MIHLGAVYLGVEIMGQGKIRLRHIWNQTFPPFPSKLPSPLLCMPLQVFAVTRISRLADLIRELCIWGGQGAGEGNLEPLCDPHPCSPFPLHPFTFPFIPSEGVALTRPPC